MLFGYDVDVYVRVFVSECERKTMMRKKILFSPRHKKRFSIVEDLTSSVVRQLDEYPFSFTILSGRLPVVKRGTVRLVHINFPSVSAKKEAPAFEKKDQRTHILWT